MLEHVEVGLERRAGLERQPCLRARGAEIFASMTGSSAASTCTVTLWQPASACRSPDAPACRS